MNDLSHQRLKTLLEAARHDDRPAFAEIVRRFQDMAVGYAYMLLGDFHLAEDAAQEAFVTAYTELDRLRQPAAFPGWFRRLVFKHCDRISRRARGHLPLDTADTPDRGLDAPDTAYEKTEQNRRLHAALGALPEPQRLVVSLYYLGQRRHQEIAGFLGIPVQTVKNRLYAARKRLKKEWTPMAEKTLHDNSPSRDTRFVTRTLDELTRLSDRAVQHLLRRADYQDCILALQGASDEVRQKLLGNMSQRVRTFMEEELEASQADETAVQQAQRRLLDGLRQLRPSPGKQTAEYRARKRALKKRLKTHPVSRLDCEELTRLFGDLAAIAQQEGVLALEEYAQLMGDDPDDYLISLGLNRAVIGHDPTSNTRILEKRCRLLEEQLATRHRMILEGIALLQQRCLPAWMHEHLRAHYTLENESPQNLKGSSPPS